MHMRLTGELARGLVANGLSLPDYFVLAALSDEPDHRARLSRLGTQMGWEKSRLSHHIARMESRGLVERSRCPADRRGWFVTMTDEGQHAISAAAPAHVEQVRALFIDVLTPRQLNAVAAAARAVLGHLDTLASCDHDEQDLPK